MQCERHPNVETNISCGKCGKPICPRCMVQTPVGLRCSECANVKKLPTYQVSTVYYLRAVGAGIGIAVACGFVWWILEGILPFILLNIIVAAGAGYAIGEVIGLSVNRKRGTGLAIIGGASSALSFAIAFFLIPLVLYGVMPALYLLSLIALAAAVIVAVIRLR